MLPCALQAEGPAADTGGFFRVQGVAFMVFGPGAPCPAWPGAENPVYTRMLVFVHRVGVLAHKLVIVAQRLMQARVFNGKR